MLLPKNIAIYQNKEVDDGVYAEFTVWMLENAY